MSDVKKPPYTEFPNELIDKVMCEVSFPAWKVLTVIVRKTWGWHTPKAKISYSYFKAMTEIKSYSTIQEAVDELVEKGFVRVSAKTPKSTREFELVGSLCYPTFTGDVKESFTGTVNSKETKRKGAEVPWKQKLPENAFAPDEYEDALGGMSRIFGLR